MWRSSGERWRIGDDSTAAGRALADDARGDGASMAAILVSYLQSIWSFFTLRQDDLRISTQLVQKLPIPEQTKQFVFAVRDPGSQAIVYILAVQNLSEQSCSDVDNLIRAVQPSAVIVQVDPSAIDELQVEEKSAQENSIVGVPASPVEVLKRCFVDKISKDQYEKIAGSLVLKEIFGVGLYGHFLAAKSAAQQAGSSFLYLESPYEKCYKSNQPDGTEKSSMDVSVGFHGSFLGPGSVSSSVSSQLNRLGVTEIFQSQMMKSLVPFLNVVISQANNNEEALSKTTDAVSYNLIDDYQAPHFARTVYPLLDDIYAIFAEIPAVGQALEAAQNMLTCIHEGKPVDSQTLASVYTFRIAIEGLRVGFNSAARSSYDSRNSKSSPSVIFSELPKEEKCHALFAKALQSQARRFGSVVAVVDASCLAGLRRQWNTPVPSDILDLADLCFSEYGEDDEDLDDELIPDSVGRRALLADKPVVAVGAGATAILSASSLSKMFHAPTFVKLAAYKVPLALKQGLLHMKRKAAVGLAKVISPTKLVAGSQTSAFQIAASAEKLHAVTHTVVTSAQRTSLMAVRTAFYEVMQKKRLRPVKATPWVTFGCSVATCAGLLAYGDGIECVAEAAPSIPMIATLGRGLEGLRAASEEVRRTSDTRIRAALRSLLTNLKNSTT